MREWFGTIDGEEVKTNSNFERELNLICEPFGLRQHHGKYVFAGNGRLVPHDIPYITYNNSVQNVQRVPVFASVVRLEWYIQTKDRNRLIFQLQVKVFDRDSNLISNFGIEIWFPPEYPLKKPEVAVNTISSREKLGSPSNLLSGNVICMLSAPPGKWEPQTDNVRRALDGFVAWVVRQYKNNKTRTV